MEKLKRYDLNCNIFDVYDYDGLSMQELLCQFYTKINECVDFSNSTLNLCSWLVNEGLKEEVAEKLIKWLNDGTLNNIINTSVFNELNAKLGKIENVVNWINPDDFNGSDVEKLQHAIDKAVITHDEIVLTREYNITYGTLKINKPNVGDRKILHIRGINGGITKNDSGYMFTSDVLPIDDIIYLGDVKLSNLLIKSVSGAKTRVIDCNRIIRVLLENNQYINVDCILHSNSGYIQTARLINEHITGGCGYLVDCEECYDVTISDCIVEHRENVFIQRSIESTESNVDPTGLSSNNVRIVNNLFEGLTSSDSVLKFGFTTALTIEGNYFECNNGVDIDLSLNPCYGVTVKGNYFHDNNVEKYCISLPTFALNYGESSDQYNFIGNMCKGGAWLFGFNKSPNNMLKFNSMGNYCSGDKLIKSNNELFNILTKYTTTNNNVEVKYVNGLKILSKAEFVDIQGDNTQVIEVNMHNDIDVTKDIITVCVTSSNADNENVAVFETKNIYATGKTVKVMIRNTTQSVKMASIFIKVLQG